MTVVRNAVRNRVGPIGASRYCQRRARAQYVRPTQTSAAASRSTRARPTCAQTSPRFARLRNHANRAIARSEPLRRIFIEPTKYQALIARRPLVLRTVASLCCLVRCALHNPHADQGLYRRIEDKTACRLAAPLLEPSYGIAPHERARCAKYRCWRCHDVRRTDRISAFDYVWVGHHGQGQSPSRLSEFWLRQTGDIVTNH